jgi:hypothetical protein
MARQGLGIAGAFIGAYFGGPYGAQIGYAIGSTLGGYIDPEKVQGPKLGQIPMQTGRDGVPIPVGWGICHTAGNIIQQNQVQEVEKEEGGGKGGGPVVVNTYYYQTFAISIMRSIQGPIASVRRIWENEKLVYDVTETPAIPAEDTQAFADGIRIYLGDEAQTPDPDLEAEWGVGNCPYYRGLPYIVFVDKDLTDFGASIPQYRFEIETLADLTITSQPYSLEAVEGFDATFALTKMRPLDAPKEGFDATFAVTQITIAAQRTFYNVPEEGFDATFAVTGITLKDIREFYVADPEGFDATFAVQSITLDPIRVTYDVPEEGFDATFTVTDITLS